MTSESNQKFSEKELHDCKNWQYPDVSETNYAPSSQKENLTKKHKEIPKKSDKTVVKSGETVEIIEDLVSAITAEQLQEITDAAEKEGFDSGYENGYEKGLEQGVQEGREKGHSEGYQQGLDDAKKLITAQCEQLQHVIDALLIPLETEQQQLQDMILNMVSELTRAVVLRELKHDSSHITQLVDDALNTIPVGADKFSLYLNAQDVAIVEEHLEYFQYHQEKSLQLHIDDELLPGGCRLETKQTVVDYTVEQRLKKVIDGFLHKRFVNHTHDSEKEDAVGESVENIAEATEAPQKHIPDEQGQDETTPSTTTSPDIETNDESVEEISDHSGDTDMNLESSDANDKRGDDEFN